MSPKYIPKSLRKLVAEQAQYRCGYCLTSEAIVGTPMQIDHIIPQAAGGLTKEENLWLACNLCNDYKNDRIDGVDPEVGKFVRIFDPRHQNWKEHFAWSSDGSRIIGLTSCGRATVVMLNLNRPSLVAARLAWVAVGWHPPKD